jgi:hypothetical protein
MKLSLSQEAVSDNFCLQKNNMEMVSGLKLSFMLFASF